MYYETCITDNLQVAKSVSDAVIKRTKRTWYLLFKLATFQLWNLFEKMCYVGVFESCSFLNSFHPQTFGGTRCVTIVVFAVPSAPPEDVRCAALSSQSLQVSWHPPPHIHSNGAVQGYRLSYDTSDQGTAVSPIIQVEEALFTSMGGVFLVEKVQITTFRFSNIFRLHPHKG